MAGLTAKRPTDTGKKEHRLYKKMRAFTQAMPSPRKGWKAGDMSPKAHTSFTPQEIKHQPKHTPESNKHKGNINGVKVRKKRTQTEWSMHKTPLTCTQPIYGRWATGQGIQTVWSGGGEKEGVYFGVPAQTSLGRDVLLGWHLTQKK